MSFSPNPVDICPEEFSTQFAASIIHAHYPDYTHDYQLIPFFNQHDLAQGGFGRSTLHFLQKRDGTLLCVIKGYRIEASDLPELELLLPACDLLRCLPFTHSSLALPFAAAHYQKEAVYYQLLATKAAPGSSLISYLKNLSQIPSENELDHKIAFQTLFRSVQKTALALAEMHTFSPYRDRPLSTYLINVEDAVFTHFLNLLHHEPSLFPFSEDAFKQRFATLFSAAHSIPFASGYIHGDSNITNIFYDNTTNQLTFIDSLTLFHSIDHEGYPRGNIVQDYACCRCSLDIYGTFYQLSDHEKQLIDALFAHTYRTNIAPGNPQSEPRPDQPVGR